VKASDRRAVILGGPTASGKSALALTIAAAFDGVIINADSMQVYRELPVLTAQPTGTTRAQAPHRLYGFLAITDRCSAGRWAELARAEIETALAARRLPIIVGGTGLYIAALLNGLAPVPAVPAAVRTAAQQRLADLGKAAFHAELSRRDPITAARIRPTDSQRMVRAWEVIEATGRSLAVWQTDRNGTGGDDDVRFIRLVLLPAREELYAACSARFATMIECGALEEARYATGLGLDPGLPAMKALGLRELIDHLRGRMRLAEAIVAAQQATRRYAKRQITWFRHQLTEALTLTPETPIGQYSERFLDEIFRIIRECR
jgi:tRNA dimethylallyltransferase